VIPGRLAHPGWNVFLIAFRWIRAWQLSCAKFDRCRALVGRDWDIQLLQEVIPLRVHFRREAKNGG